MTSGREAPRHPALYMFPSEASRAVAASGDMVRNYTTH